MWSMILVGLSIVGCLVSMALSAMAASDAHKADMEKAKKFATASAVISGISAFALFVALGICWMYGKGGKYM
jgi:hypothetical protein